MIARTLRRYPVAATAAAGMAAAGVAWAMASAAAADRVLLVTLLAGGTPLVLQTVRGLLRGRFAADLVATLAILTALVLGEYFAGAVIVLMQSGGEALEQYAMGRASDALEALLERAPKVGHRLRDGTIEEVPVDAIRPGDELVIRPGDLVPVDGTVTAGDSTVDESAITGEPRPLHARVGVAVRSGSLNQHGALHLVAVRPASESQYQQIVRLVARARAERPPIQRLADRWAVWFTPLTLVMCGVAWLVTGHATSVLAVLVVATPCPLILATPVAVIGGISRAARAGVIVKTGAAIEQLGRARVVVFDKTGTLTLGRPVVHDVYVANGTTASELLRLVAAVEQLSSHHLGAAIVQAARGQRLELPPPRDFRETPGLGAEGRVDGRRVAVGSAAYLGQFGVTVPEVADDATVAFVALDGRLAGEIRFADRLRHQVPALLQRLAVLGVTETVMLTGDRLASAEAIAALAGIRTVRADLLPADKVAAVNAYKRRLGGVIMVGDGINDAPALAAATVGIAMGGHGTAISAEAADVVLVVDDVSLVGDAITISRHMRRVALQSIAIGLGVSAGLMVLASLGLVPPALGALLQEALDAAVILNALRAR